jgi:hypothetical protein
MHRPVTEADFPNTTSDDYLRDSITNSCATLARGFHHYDEEPHSTLSAERWMFMAGHIMAGITKGLETSFKLQTLKELGQTARKHTPP